MNSSWRYSPETPNLGQNRRFLEPCDLAIWRMTLKNNRAPLLCHFKLCASFRSHRWFQTWVTVRKRPIWVKFGDFYSCVTLQFDLWPWKTIGHLFYSTSSFVHHFVTIGVLKLELQSGNAQSGSKWTIFRAVWPWNYANPVYGVATICHQVRWVRWGHPSLFHIATSLWIWYEMSCVREIIQTYMDGIYKHVFRVCTIWDAQSF